MRPARRRPTDPALVTLVPRSMVRITGRVDDLGQLRRHAGRVGMLDDRPPDGQADPPPVITSAASPTMASASLADGPPEEQDGAPDARP